MPALIAIAAGAFLVVLALVPWVAVQYRRRGEFGFGQTVIAAGTLVYALAIVTYTMLPLPSDVPALCATGGAGRQWHPGQFLTDIAHHGGWNLHNPAVLQFAFNVVLFVPLGMVVRYVAMRRRPAALGIAVATLAGLAGSLLIETTQLTGNWFLYPCAYRVFDVDDLIANTGGALLGGIVAPLLALIPGQRQRLSAREPRPVGWPRRLMGMVCDVLTLGIIGVAAGIIVNLVAVTSGVDVGGSGVLRAQVVVSFLPTAVQLAMVLVTGRTVGEAAVRLRPARRANAAQRLVRWAFGSGGWWVLIEVNARWATWAAIALAAVGIVAVWTTRHHRGLAAALARIEIADDRAPAEVSAATVGREEAGGKPA